MRVNMPVTNEEKKMQDGEFLVSRTNAKGVITYVNPQFIAMSGFTEEELIGQAHNIVRHPDMPPEAFKDFWETLKSGKPWSGMVKNRSKNGEFYWVYANATPLIEGGQITGYMSVRSKPSREQIQAAEALYADMRNNSAKFKVVEGVLVEKGMLGALKYKLKHVSIRARIMLMLLFTFIGFSTLGVFSFYGLNQGNEYLTLGIVGAGTLILMSLAGTLLLRSIEQPLKPLITALHKMSEGDYTNQLTVTNYDVIGNLVEAVKSLQIRGGNDLAESKQMVEDNKKVISELDESKIAIAKEMEESARVAEESLRIKNALDQSLSAVMIVDLAGTINYVNGSMKEMFDTGEADLRKVLNGFKASDIMGKNFSIFNLKVNLSQSQPLKESVEIGARSYVLTTVPVVNEAGEQSGVTIEWVDRTSEIGVEKEVARIVSAANDGDFSGRLSLEGKDGFLKQLAEGINGLMETSSVGLNEVVRVLSALAKGDLTEKMTNEYKGTFGQLKSDANTTVDKLNEIISDIRAGSASIDTSSKEISAGNNDLSQRTEEQASSLEETASSMEELTATVKQNADNAKQANQLAIGASEVAVKGGSVVGQVVTTMSDINDSSKKIVEIISVIDGIAFQTNILALNAAVEAARAGEQGRGFAVVATEVRTLAQRSAAAAKEIKELIDDSVGKVDEGSQLVDHAGKTMEEIVQSIKRVTDIMAEISAASQEQSSGIEQVNQAITKMDETTQQNSALVEQAAAASESMLEQSGNLLQSVSVFQLGKEASIGSISNPKQERRGPNRAVNVERLPNAAAQSKLKASTPAKSGTDDDWCEF